MGRIWKNIPIPQDGNTGPRRSRSYGDGTVGSRDVRHQTVRLQQDVRSTTIAAIFITVLTLLQYC